MINAAVNGSAGGGPSTSNNLNSVLGSNTIRHANSNIHQLKSTSSLSGIILDPTVVAINEN